MAIVRATALCALLAGCGGDDDGAKPATDGGGIDGGNDAGHDASIDAGTDSGTDACVTAPPTDGGTALSDALKTTGVVTTQDRARLIAPAYCELWTGCVADAGTASECTTSSLADYAETVTAGTSAACLDAVLDLWACLAVRESCATSQCTAAQARCQAAADARDTLCEDDAGTSNAN